MVKPAFKRVLLKLSGEALASPVADRSVNFGISHEMLERIARDIRNVYGLGVQVCLVVGGGNIFRGVHGMATHDLNRTTSDHMGMLATIINGLAMHNAIEAEGMPCRLMSAVPMETIAEFYVRLRAIRHMEKGRVVIFSGGTGNPYFTTDTAATLRASEMECDLMLKATKVDGVYTEDPAKNPNAEFIANLSYQDVLINKIGVMDATAIALAQENHLPVRIFSIYKENGFVDAICNNGRFTKIS